MDEVLDRYGVQMQLPGGEDRYLALVIHLSV
jgi:hypothetical protein